MTHDARMYICTFNFLTLMLWPPIDLSADMYNPYEVTLAWDCITLTSVTPPLFHIWGPTIHGRRPFPGRLGTAVYTNKLEYQRHTPPFPKQRWSRCLIDKWGFQWAQILVQLSKCLPVPQKLLPSAGLRLLWLGLDVSLSVSPVSVSVGAGVPTPGCRTFCYHWLFLLLFWDFSLLHVQTLERLTRAV